MQVNHIDTNKCNNMASNLEHLTGSDNQKHAVATGLQPSGEDRLNSLFTNEFVEEVCELMEKGLRTKDIIYLYKDKYDKKSLKYLISDIRRKRGWMFISNKYDIVKDTYRLMLDRIRLMIDNNMGFDDIYNILINEMGYSMVQRSLRDIMRYIKKRGSTTIESTLDMGESE